jgi:membrane fusion protein, multidrug efflux system
VGSDSINHNFPLVEGQPGAEEALESERRARSTRSFWLSVLILLIVFGGFLLWKLFGPRFASAPSNAKGPANAGLNVVVAKAHRGSIPVYINGLGAVTPVYTVTLNSVISGQLMDVHYQEGQTVQKGDLLVQIDPRPYETLLTQYEGALERDQAYLANARIDLDRYRTLWARNAIPQQELATQEALVKQYEGIVETDQGQIDTAKLDIQYCRVTAPITGRVGLRLVDPGNVVSANSTALLVITQMQPITVVFTISEDQLPAVLAKVADGQELQVTALDRAGVTQLSQGTLETIDNQIDPTTGTVKLRATFANHDQRLFPNQFVNARLLLEEKRNVTLVPNTGIQRNSQSTYAWVVKPDHTVTMRPIVVGTSGATESQITSGLSPGETVVIDGVDRLQEGSHVNPQPEGSPGKSQAGASQAPPGHAAPSSGKQKVSPNRQPSRAVRSNGQVQSGGSSK